MKITVFYNHVSEACKQTGKSLQEVANILTAHGISGVEMDYADLKKNAGKMFEELEAVGLPVNCVYIFFDWGNHPKDLSYRRILRKLSKYGVKNVMAIPGFVKEGQDRELYRERMTETLQKMCHYAGRKNIRVFMEDFDGKEAVFATAEGVKWFLDRIPELHCTFDTGNFLYSGELAEQVLPLLIDRVGYVHCKDRSLEEKPGETPLESVAGVKMYSASVGSGVIPMEEILQKLRAVGYDGTYAIEHFGSQHHLEDMVASADWLRERLTK